MKAGAHDGASKGNPPQGKPKDWGGGRKAGLGAVDMPATQAGSTALPPGHVLPQEGKALSPPGHAEGGEAEAEDSGRMRAAEQERGVRAEQAAQAPPGGADQASSASYGPAASPAAKEEGGGPKEDAKSKELKEVWGVVGPWVVCEVYVVHPSTPNLVLCPTPAVCPAPRPLCQMLAVCSAPCPLCPTPAVCPAPRPLCQLFLTAAHLALPA